MRHYASIRDYGYIYSLTIRHAGRRNAVEIPLRRRRRMKKPSVRQVVAMKKGLARWRVDVSRQAMFCHTLADKRRVSRMILDYRRSMKD